jgi:hypothetical protein
VILFETDKKPLTFLLDQIENRYLALPDFQRSFVWDPAATRELVVSIIRSFPAGTLLQMEGGGKVFAPRAFEEAPALNGNPTHLILDGQQRLTSLYQAFSGTGTHRFFLNVGELLDGESIDEAVEVYAVKRARRWDALEHQADDMMLPLSTIRSFTDWKDDVLDIRERRGEEVRKLRKQLNEIEKEFVDPVKLYNFPVTTLSATTPVEAVCTIFETLNRTGVKLSVFELLTARAFAHDVRLREMWEEARDTHPVLIDFDVNPYYALQVVAMNVKKSPQRFVVLGLDIPDIVNHWDEAIEGLAQSLVLLRDQCGVLAGKWVPYETMLITMASAWRSVLAATGPAVGAMRSKLERWFWCSAFAQAYENSGNSVTEQDVPRLRRWLEGGAAPEVVASFRFDSNRWGDITVRQRALYRATMALLMRNSPRDFHNGIPLSKPVIDAHAVDDHHVFPRSYLKAQGRGKAVDSVLNHSLIDRMTNIRIGGRAPSVYLAEMEAELGDDLSAILSSHRLPAEKDGPLYGDRFEEFLEWRLGQVGEELRAATGGEVGPAVAPMEIDIAHEEAEPETYDPTNDREEVANLLNEFSPASIRPWVDGFVDEVSGWGEVRMWSGKSQYPERRKVFFSRRGSQRGAFAWLLPRAGNVRPRLAGSDAPHGSRAMVLNAKHPYQLRITLDADEQLKEAIELCRLAYDRAVP